MFVPDILHEFELGVWKGTFNHIVRLIHAQGDAAVKEFDRRYVTDFLSVCKLTGYLNLLTACVRCHPGVAIKCDGFGMMCPHARSWRHAIMKPT